MIIYVEKDGKKYKCDFYTPMGLIAELAGFGNFVYCEVSVAEQKKKFFGGYKTVYVNPISHQIGSYGNAVRSCSFANWDAESIKNEAKRQIERYLSTVESRASAKELAGKTVEVS